MEIKTSLSMEENITIFSYLVIEEFLMKKKMTHTLSSFREEWGESRPDTAQTSISWLNIALKLHLPDLAKSSPEKSVVEHITTTLIKNSATRMRTEPEILVSGLAETPRIKTIPLPPLSPAKFSTEEDHFDRILNEMEEEAAILSKCKLKATSIRNNYVNSPIRQSDSRKRSNINSTKQSAENWIPETTRFRSLHRDLQTLDSNLKSTITMENELQRELRTFIKTDLEKVQIKESLGLLKKSPCACCLQSYSEINLPMKIPIKAILDIRKKWTNTHQNNNTTQSNWWEKEDERLRAIPRCYEGVKICLFCSQFFHNQEEYRPSFEMVQGEIKEKHKKEMKRREREYWDPLKMIEKDRDRIESMGGTIGSNYSPTENVLGLHGVTTIDME